MTRLIPPYLAKPNLSAPRWVSRAVIVLAILFSFTVAAWWFGQPAVRRLSILYWQRGCMSHLEPDSTIASQVRMPGYEALMARGGYVWCGPGCVCRSPQAWAELSRVLHGNRTAIFCHERRRSVGNRRLVVIHDDLSFSVIKAGSLFRAPAAACTFGNSIDVPSFVFRDLVSFASLRLFAGQPDPNDPAHFVIRYELENQPGIIDGWLQDDDSVKMNVREGPGKPTLEEKIVAERFYDLLRSRRALSPPRTDVASDFDPANPPKDRSLSEEERRRIYLYQAQQSRQRAPQ